jgi:hypothetical protein
VRTGLGRAIAIVAAISIAIAAIAPARRAVLRDAGLLLTASDDPQPADFLVMDVESGAAGVLMVSDLYRAHPAAAVGIFEPHATRPVAELIRRGVVLPNLASDVLVQLGVPAGIIERIPVREEGTTETAAALADWVRRHHPRKRVLVVVGPSHGRRYRRALRRVWPEEQAAPLVVTTPHAMFRPEDWWQSRATAREGLIELQKLALDYVRHPW